MNQKIIDLVNDQIDKEILWVDPESGTEELLQQALRDLHAAIEDSMPKADCYAITGEAE